MENRNQFSIDSLCLPYLHALAVVQHLDDLHLSSRVVQLDLRLLDLDVDLQTIKNQI